MTEGEKLAWIAGFFDGEGCIYLSRPTCQNGYDKITGAVIICQNEIKTLNLIVDIMAAHNVIGRGPYTHNGKQHRLEYSWHKGSKFLKLILPYIQDPGKKERALFYINFFSVSGQVGGAGLSQRKKKLWLEWLKIRASAKKQY